MSNLNIPLSPSRRSFLHKAAGGFGGLALSSMLSASGGLSSGTHFPARAKRVIQIFCSGGLSHVDTFDYKPELERRAGTPFDPDGKLQFFASKPGNCRPSFWKFRRHGQSGIWMSDLLPKLATCVDDMAFIYSMQSKTALHGPGNFMMNTGQILPGFPSMGSWVTYGLGCETDNLPSFVVLPDKRGLPPGGIINWGAGFLPAQHQATTVNVNDPDQPIADLFPPKSFTMASPARDRVGLSLLEKLNKIHKSPRAGNTELEARIKAYEMAARLQLSAPEVTDLKRESEATKRLYELDHPDIGSFGRQCLLARRLVERGVRFVQLYCGAENTTAEKIRPNWDSHEDLPRDHGYWGPILDAGASALLKDLKSRGMLRTHWLSALPNSGANRPLRARRPRDGTTTEVDSPPGLQEGVSNLEPLMARPMNSASRQSTRLRTVMSSMPPPCIYWDWITNDSPGTTTDSSSALPDSKGKE